MVIKLYDDKEISVKINNARILLLDFDSKLVKIDYDSIGKISLLEFDSGFHIEKGDLLPIISDCKSKALYQVNNLEIVNQKEDYNKIRIKIINEEINKTSHWLLPFIASTEDTLLYNTLLVNSYIKSTSEMHEYYNNGEYLFLRYQLLKKDQDKLDKLTNHPNFVKVDKIFSRTEHIYIFKIPQSWINDKQLLIQGAYSKISAEAKIRILKFHGLSKKGKTGKILYKDKSYMEDLKKEFGIRDDLTELHSKFDIQINKEILYESNRQKW